ncbi:hypothetical protein [Chryseobacterium sp. MYb328]|uniref:hypothetical protein n=1 Tax=Chryseobacterium sp. MYb328 TaxID=2745231 RepID=UPI0030AD386F
MGEEKVKELWGDVLYKAFAYHINEEGWLTTDWGVFVEKNYSDFDKDYNDNEEKKDIYQRMYLLDLEEKETESGTWIRPI